MSTVAVKDRPSSHGEIGRFFQELRHKLDVHADIRLALIVDPHIQGPVEGENGGIRPWRERRIRHVFLDRLSPDRERNDAQRLGRPLKACDVRGNRQGSVFQWIIGRNFHCIVPNQIGQSERCVLFDDRRRIRHEEATFRQLQKVGLPGQPTETGDQDVTSWSLLIVRRQRTYPHDHTSLFPILDIQRNGGIARERTAREGFLEGYPAPIRQEDIETAAEAEPTTRNADDTFVDQNARDSSARGSIALRPDRDRHVDNLAAGDDHWIGLAVAILVIDVSDSTIGCNLFVVEVPGTFAHRDLRHEQVAAVAKERKLERGVLRQPRTTPNEALERVVTAVTSQGVARIDRKQQYTAARDLSEPLSCHESRSAPGRRRACAPAEDGTVTHAAREICDDELESRIRAQCQHQ